MSNMRKHPKTTIILLIILAVAVSQFDQYKDEVFDFFDRLYNGHLGVDEVVQSRYSYVNESLGSLDVEEDYTLRTYQ